MMRVKASWSLFLMVGLLLSRVCNASTVRGFVVQGVSGVPLSGIEVILYSSKEGSLRELQRTITGAKGRFSFSTPDLDITRHFVLSATYKTVPHYSSTLNVEDLQEVILEVYEPTQEVESIHIANYTLLFTLTPNSLEVIHLVQVENEGTKTYIGQKPGHVTPFILPSGLTHLQSHVGNLIRANEELFFDTQPLLPGTTQIAFTFSLDIRKAENGYLHQVSYPTDRLEIFSHPETFSVAQPFIDLGIVDLHGKRYRHLLLEKLESGQQWLIPLPIVRSMRWLLKWIALGLTLLCGLILFLLRPDPSLAPEKLRRQRQELLERIARLDDAYSNQKKDPHYQAERAHLIHQISLVFRLLEEMGNEKD